MKQISQTLNQNEHNHLASNRVRNYQIEAAFKADVILIPGMTASPHLHKKAFANIELEIHFTYMLKTAAVTCNCDLFLASFYQCRYFWHYEL